MGRFSRSGLFLIFSQYYPPEVGAAEERMEQMARCLEDLGQRPIIVAGMPNHPVGIVPRPLRWRFAAWSMHRGIPALRVYTYVRRTRTMLSRGLSYVSYFVSAVIAGLRFRMVGAVVGQSPSPFSALAGALVARIKGVPFIADIHDLWPDDALDMGEMRSLSLYKLLRLVEQLIYLLSWRIFVVTPRTRAILTGTRRVPERKVVLMPLTIETERLRRVDGTPFRKRFGFDRKFLVVYAGTIGVCQRLSFVIDAAELTVHRADVLYVFVGDGAEKPMLEQEARRRGLRNVVFTGPLPFSDMACVYSAADLGLVVLAPSNRDNNTIPGKLYSLLATETPVLLACAGESRWLLDCAGGGIEITPGDPHELAKVVLAAADSGATPAPYGRTLIENEYSLEAFKRRLEDVFAPVLSNEAIRVRHPSGLHDLSDYYNQMVAAAGVCSSQDAQSEI